MDYLQSESNITSAYRLSQKKLVVKQNQQKASSSDSSSGTFIVSYS